ncbi:MAG: phosphatidylserine decarboxylase [Bdellovibrio sp.]|nr:MAG: phosphatidylserine decarboxylase [Bdellovibrio sp.]
MILLYLLPKNLMSRISGWWMDVYLPRFLRKWILGSFARFFRIQVEDAEQPLLAYHSVGEFFVRRLKGDLRPLGSSLVLHPVDGRVTEVGKMEHGQLLQAKGLSYSSREFLAGFEGTYQDGGYVTYYLCPTDYHRVHWPVSGWLHRIVHVPGTLWPVNSWSTHHISQIFCKNERVILEVETEYGWVAVILVGATNVGRISLAAWPDFRSNLPMERKTRIREFSPGQRISKGDELGAFHLGSTVVLIFSKEFQAAVHEVPHALPKLAGQTVQVRSNFNSVGNGNGSWKSLTPPPG